MCTYPLFRCVARSVGICRSSRTGGDPMSGWHPVPFLAWNPPPQADWSNCFIPPPMSIHLHQKAWVPFRCQLASSSCFFGSLSMLWLLLWQRKFSTVRAKYGVVVVGKALALCQSSIWCVWAPLPVHHWSFLSTRTNWNVREFIWLHIFTKCSLNAKNWFVSYWNLIQTPRFKGWRELCQSFPQNKSDIFRGRFFWGDVTCEEKLVS